MGENILELVIRARDEASKTIENVGKNANGLAGILEKSFKGAALASGAALGALAVEAKTAIDAFSESQKVTTQLDAVLKSTKGAAGMTAEQITGLANKLSLLTPYEDDAILSGQNMLLTFTNISKDIFPQTTEAILDMSTALGQDLKGSAIQLGKALQDPVIGVTALRRVGVAFTEEQQKQMKVLAESGHLLEAQKMILKELQIEFGGSARAAGETFAGKLTILQNTIQNVQEGIGKLLVNAVYPLLPKLITLASIIQSVAEGSYDLDDVTASLRNHFGALGDIMGRALVLFTTNKTALTILTGAIAGFLSIAVVGIGILAVKMALLSAISLPVIAAFVAIGVGIALLVTHFNEIKPLLDNVKNKFLEIWTALQPVINGLMAIFTPLIQQMVNTLLPQLQQAFSQIVAALQPLIPVLQFVGQVILGVLVVGFLALVGAIMLIIPALTGLLSGFIQAFTGIIQFVSGAIQFVVGFFQIISGLIVGLVTGDFTLLSQGWQNLWNGIGSVLMGAVNFIVGIVRGFFTAVVNVFQELWAVLVGQSIIPDMVNSIIGWFLSIPDKIIAGITDGLNRVKQLFADLAKGVMDALHTIKFPHVSVGSGSAMVAGKKIDFPTLNVNWYQQGGFVGNTGLAMLHAGEYVLSKDMISGSAPMSSEVQRIFNQPITINAQINGQADFDLLGYKLAWHLRNSR